jgi:hypothetical protein
VKQPLVRNESIQVVEQQDCQIYHSPKHQTGENIPNYIKIYQMDIKYFQWTNNRSNDHKIYRDFPKQYPTKLTQIGIFGLKTNHLATLVGICSTQEHWPQKLCSYLD